MGTFGTSAYGGARWQPRVSLHADELGRIWAPYRIASEWHPLSAVILHCPGPELLAAQDDPEAALMLDALDLDIARQEHAAIADVYRALGIEVVDLAPAQPATPNQMFCADLFAMTPQGAILARPAGEVRAGEERFMAARLAQLGVPILRTLTADATFEGADLMWLDATTAMIGRGHRTNPAAISAIDRLFSDLGYRLLPVDLPFGTMHFMGMLRIVDHDMAICWPRRTPFATVQALRERGFEVLFPPYEDDQPSYRAMNFVTLGPRRILMSEGLPKFQAFFEDHGIECVTAKTDELSKAAGGIGCLTGVLSRNTEVRA